MTQPTTPARPANSGAKWHTDADKCGGTRRLTAEEYAALIEHYGTPWAARNASREESSGTGWIAHPTCHRCYYEG